MTGDAAWREDIFVSIGLIGTEASPAAADALIALIRRMDERFRYWELLFVTNSDDAETHEWLLRTTAKMRLVKVRPGTPGYRRRLSVANEAIGDILVISAPEEFAQVDLLALIAECERSESIVSVRHPKSAWGTALIAAVGRGAGFHVDGRDMVTAAFPRPLVNRLLKHTDPQLAVRFPPIDRNVPVRVAVCVGTSTGKRVGSLRLIGYRLAILQQIVVTSAPTVLGLVGLLSLFLAVAAALFAVYAAVVWLSFDAVQPGWFTTSILLSMTAMFLGLAIFGVSIGIQRLLDLAANVQDDDVLDEVNPIDLFASVAQELNIEVDDQRANAVGMQAAPRDTTPA